MPAYHEAIGACGVACADVAMVSAKPTTAIDLIISAPSASFVATLVGCKPLFEQSLLYEGAGGIGDRMKKSASTFAGHNNYFFNSRLWTTPSAALRALTTSANALAYAG